jgi:predicted membrane chloride channel (bestrophin family)
MNLELKYLRKKWSVALQVLPLLCGIVVLKFILHRLGWEVLSLNPLFTSIVAATTFLLGFLITGVLTDYKESEKIPGEMAVAIAAIADEAACVKKSKKCKQASELLEHVTTLVGDIINWFHKKERTKLLMQKISDMNEHFVDLEPFTQVTFLNRMKQEQSNLRRAVIRSHTIRETKFFPPAYAIVEALAFLLIVGMLILKLEPFWESVFFIILVSFVVLYMIFLIKDLDNPFDYTANHDASNEISLKPLYDFKLSLQDGSKDNV